MTENGNGEAVDIEQFRNVQESVRYGIHVSGTKNVKGTIEAGFTSLIPSYASQRCKICQ